MNNQKIIQNDMNQKIIQNEMLNKTYYGKPYYATNQTVGKTTTDFDNFPYDRWYRGSYTNPKPVIIEREAGYRFVENNCYRDKIVYEKNYPEHCFETACSVVYPCYPQYLRKYADQNKLDVMLNRTCVDRSL